MSVGTRLDGSNDMGTPLCVQWQIGKTVASIDFVKKAEEFLRTCQDESIAEHIRDIVQQMKAGAIVLVAEITVEEYLELEASLE